MTSRLFQPMLGWMKVIKIRFLFLLALAAVAGCKPQQSPAPPSPVPAPARPEATAPSTAAEEVAVIKTAAGEMVIEFWPDVAPNTVANFKKLARAGFYDGTCLHRIIKGFMIQGGDPLSKDPAKEAIWGTGDPGYSLKAEFNDRLHQRGVISMARSSNPDSAGSQFFICLGDAPALNNKYTAFGKLVKGDEVLGALGDTPVAPSATGEPSRPINRVNVDSIRITRPKP